MFSFGIREVLLRNLLEAISHAFYSFNMRDGDVLYDLIVSFIPYTYSIDYIRAVLNIFARP